MAVRHQKVAITTDSLGAGTATTAEPINGIIRQVRVNAVQYSATADYSITQASAVGGGTLAYMANSNGPWQITPGIPVYDDAGNKSLYSSATGGTVTAAPYCVGYATVTVAQGGNAQSGTIHIIYEG
jgi:hypothetical protein